MSFDAIQLIENAGLELLIQNQDPPPLFFDGPLIVEINGNEGYTCDAESTVDKHTADLLCQKAGYDGASGWYNRGKSSKSGI